MTDKKTETTPETQPVASFTVLKQYIKDLSFENPYATKAAFVNNLNPAANISINVDAEEIEGANNSYEVVLKFSAEAQHEGLLLFRVELEYAGIFHLENIPQEQIKPLLLIEGARLLFPFARHLISTTTSEGGYMPLLLEPVNFAALYYSTLEAQAAAEEAAKNEDKNSDKKK